MKNEIEATFLSVDKDSMRAKLKEAGFELKTPEYMMRRKTFSFSRVAPGRKKWGRVRQESDKVTMTVKEIRGSGITILTKLSLLLMILILPYHFLRHAIFQQGHSKKICASCGCVTE